ncbi:SARP family transcriptional regulator [Streptosporangiaceae bacterium NEAU-GS5]|nr:SARP family transcriptional regulator [Streptosporangiaceae bacterium NEAU-GS5]
MSRDATRADGTIRSGRLQLFDGFRLEVNGSDIDASTAAQRLLAFLSLHGPAVRPVVAGTLWGHTTESKALGSLRTTMWRVNHAAPGLVSTEHGRLALAGAITVDATEFGDRASARLRGGREADLPFSDLRAGVLLPGWYDDWVIFERERLRQLRLHALEAVAVELCARGQYAVALDTAYEAVRDEPLRESARRAVILIHLAEGNFAEALWEFERFRTLLGDQLGVEPSPDLVRLVNR